MFVTIKNKRAYLDKGTLLKSLGASRVVSADCTDDYALLVYDSGKAELRRTPSGVLLRALISKDVVGGNINANEIALRLSSGKTRILRVPSGTLIRTV